MFLGAQRFVQSPANQLYPLSHDTGFTLVSPRSITLAFVLLSLLLLSLLSAPISTCSGFRAKFRWNKWKEFRQMHRWDKQLLTAWGLFLLRSFGRQSLLVESDRSGTMGLYVSLSFSQRLSLQEPLDLLSCKCVMWAALAQIPWICLTVSLSLRFAGTFWGYCEFDVLFWKLTRSRRVGWHSLTFILNRLSVPSLLWPLPH